MESSITQEYVKNLKNITEDFLCDLNANVYNIKFLKFRVRDMESDNLLFEVSDDTQESEESDANGETNTNRSIRYHLGPEFLELRNIATELVFSVGNLPVKNLVMIERHYFREKLIKSFEFKFDFCIPNSTNTWETIYEIPEIDSNLKKEMIGSPWETKSDSFYFVDNNLIMHHKAFYNYSPFGDE
jgi:hypothetical protein